MLPTIGQAGKVVSQKLTKNKAFFAEALTRAGSDGEAITKAYLTSVPKAQRNVKDLSLLLSDSNVDLASLITKSDKLIKEAAEIAAGRRVIGEALGTSVASAAAGADNGQGGQ